MSELFFKGGPIMWPLLVASLVALTTVFERLLFFLGCLRRRDAQLVESVVGHVEHGDIAKALDLGRGSRDHVAVVLTYALENRETSLSGAVLRAANQELQRFNRGLSILDTIITLAPLLGLLGTVTGMISAFGLLGGNELDAPAAITGGIAEALIATAFGLGIAILSLIPFNFLNSRLEQARHEIEDATSQLELLLVGNGTSRVRDVPYEVAA